MPAEQRALWAAPLAVLLWAFAFPASKWLLPFFSVEQIVLLRYLVACGFYAFLFCVYRFPLPALRDWPAILLLGLAGVTSYHLFFVTGLKTVSAGAASFIITTNPVFVSLLAAIFLREKLAWQRWAGIGVSIVGVAVITFGDAGGGKFTGYVFLVTAVLSIACYFVFQKLLLHKYSPLAMTSYTSVAGTLPLLWFLPQSLTAAAAAPWSALFVLLILGVFSSGLGFLLWTYALAKIRAGLVASFLFLQPVFVILLAWFWLGEIPAARAVAGGAIILIGLTLIVKTPKRADAEVAQIKRMVEKEMGMAEKEIAKIK